MVKIMFFRPLLYMGGTEIAILNLIKLLDRNKFDIYVGYSDETSNLELIQRITKYAKVVNIKEEKIEVDVLVNCSPYRSSTLYFNNVKTKKHYLWFHYFGMIGEDIFNDKDYISNLSKIITVSVATKNQMIKKYNDCDIEKKIDVIYNVLDKASIISKSKSEFEVKLSKTLNLITVSRLSRCKGFKRQAILARELVKKNIDFKWLIVGGSYYLDEEKRIKDLFHEFGEKVEFLGIQQNPYKIMKNFDYLVQLSDDETWGLTITEAKLLGIPCIVTDFDAAYEQIEDMKNGIILKRDDTDTYKDRIEDILENKDKFKENLKKFDYDIDDIVKKWENEF